MKNKIKKNLVIIFSIILFVGFCFLISPFSDGLHQKERDKLKMVEIHEREKIISAYNNSETINERKRDEEVLKILHPEDFVKFKSNDLKDSEEKIISFFKNDEIINFSKESN